MAFLTKTQKQTLDYAFEGLPYCIFSFQKNLGSLDYAFEGLPLMLDNISSNIASINGVSYDGINKINGAVIASVKVTGTA